MNDQTIKNYFCSFNREIPSALAQLDPNLTHISIESILLESEVKSGLLWFQLGVGKTIAEQIGAVKQCYPHLKLIVMSDMPNDLEALAAFSISAKAYCNTHSGIEVLQNIASVVHQGGVWIGESIMNRLLGQQMPVDDISNIINAKWDKLLTSREKEVAVFIAGGLQNRQIAEKMKITERTVKAHVGAILEKLQLKNRLQLALLVKES